MNYWQVRPHSFQGTDTNSTRVLHDSSANQFTYKEPGGIMSIKHGYDVYAYNYEMQKHKNDQDRPLA